MLYFLARVHFETGGKTSDGGESDGKTDAACVDVG